MKKLLLLLPLMGLLTACQSKQSKKEICADWVANMHSPVQTAKKLGIDVFNADPEDPPLYLYYRIGNYCAFYRR